MLARLEGLTGLAIDHLAPHLRVILSPDAVEHGAIVNAANPAVMNVNERIHWSVADKRGTLGKVFGQAGVPYEPDNLPRVIDPDKIAAIPPEEVRLFQR